MHRRTFIQTAGLASAATLLPISCFSGAGNHTFKMGYQLYSVRDAMAKDPLATLKALKVMGYQDFEAYGFNAEEGTFYGYKAAAFNEILKDLEVTMTSGHYGFAPFLEKSEDDLKRFVDQCIQGAKAVNSAYITWPWIAPEQRTMDTFKLMAGKLNLIGEQVTDAGLGFAYHNHGFEFEEHNGQTGFDIILSETDASLVKLQMDMYWVMHSAKKTPKELINDQPGRYVMWHIKDMDKITRDYSELGNGSIDYTQILPDPVTSGLEYFYIEQGGNFEQSSMQSAARSADYFKKQLQEYL
ncbi:MAG: sugar phosphate isomerase/epimerase [Flavobacteriales bacterium]|jgi:sugar phosphate isomerase/epimerase